MGLETWGESEGDGSMWRAGFEWSNTRCGGTVNGEKVWDCAYNSGIFTDGYRYYDQVMGHSMDGDGDMYSARYIRSTVQPIPSRCWRATAGSIRAAPSRTRIIRSPQGAEDWISLDVSYRRVLRSGWLEGGVGVDSQDRKWKGDQAVLPRAYVTWNYALR